MSEDLEEDQKKEQEDWPGIKLLEWCREYSRKQIEECKKESEMNIRLKERQERVLSELKHSDTFKIPESSFIFMKMDVEGLTVRPTTLPGGAGPTNPDQLKPIKVLVLEGKTVVVCLSTGKAQFLNLTEKVQIVELDCSEIVKEQEVIREKGE